MYQIHIQSGPLDRTGPWIAGWANLSMNTKTSIQGVRCAGSSRRVPLSLMDALGLDVQNVDEYRQETILWREEGFKEKEKNMLTPPFVLSILSGPAIVSWWVIQIRVFTRSWGAINVTWRPSVRGIHGKGRDSQRWNQRERKE